MLFISTLVLALMISASNGQRGQSANLQGRAEPCNPNVCRLPDCYCGGQDIPGGFRPEEIPQFVLLTFDDAVNGINKEFFSKLFKDRFNPNGCPIKVSLVLFKQDFTQWYILSD